MKKIKTYQYTPKHMNTVVLTSIEALSDLLENEDVSTEIHIIIGEMAQEELDSLPEFRGF